MGILSLFFTGPGQTFSFSIFIDSFIQDFGWSRTLVSTMYSLATLISGLLMFLIGRLVDRFGARWVCLGAAALLGVACIHNSFLVSPAMLFFGFFLARFSGQGTLGLSAGTLAPQWFVRRRAFAIMLVGMGNTIAAMVYPLMNTYLIHTLGWRMAFRVLALGVWIIYLPIAYVFLAGRPENIGLLPDGRTADEGRKDDAGVEEQQSLTQLQAIATPSFWIAAFAGFQFSMVGTGAAFHYISILREHGFTDLFAARLMSISPVVGIICAVTLGLFLDKIRRPHLIMAAACVIQMTAFILLAYLNGAPMAYARTVLSGASGSVLMLCIGVLKPLLFGRRYIGGISGAMSVIMVVGSALGPVMFGVAYDVLNGYRQVLLISAFLPAIASVAAIFIKRPIIKLKLPETMPPS